MTWPEPVRFGTSGFRGALGESFTFERAAALVRAVADTLGASADRQIVVAHDTRFLGDRFAADAAEILAGAGFRPRVGRGPTPTPAACFAVRKRRAAAGLLFTASHNRAVDQGLKVVGPDGGAASRSFTDRVERRVAQLLTRGGEPPRRAHRARVDLVEPYRAHLSRHVRPDPAGARRLSVVFDALHGTGAGVVDSWLREAGCEVETLHAELDPTFGGEAPDPTAARLLPLGRRVRARGADFGVATDGDADRIAFVDGRGRRLSESDAVALLIDHLARTGRASRGVALSIATGGLPERVARSYGLPVTRSPIGFKPLSEELIAGRADVAGEESGGFAFEPVSRDKDGILAAALCAERLAQGGGSLAGQVRALHRAHGSSAAGRRAVPATEAKLEALRRLARRLPRRLFGRQVLEVRSDDGLHVRLDDGGFVMWRASGTESVLRVYAEAPTRAALERRLQQAQRLLAGGG